VKTRTSPFAQQEKYGGQAIVIRDFDVAVDEIDLEGW
jgi:hypothetical protein